MDGVNRRVARVRIGRIWIDAVTFDEALDRIGELVARGRGGSVFTPNIDHVVKADEDPVFAQAYQGASLSLVDGKALQWAAQWAGTPLPEKISGSDLILPLMKRAAGQGWRVFLLGAGPGVADEAAGILREAHGVDVVGTASPMLAKAGDPALETSVLNQIRATRAQLVVVALGAPKQELFIHRSLDRLAPAVALGLGASLDFVAGRVSRAPGWISKSGLEWIYRMAHEPRRLWRRYLVEDARFPSILLRTVREPREDRYQAAR